jgi:hypothetical protein
MKTYLVQTVLAALMFLLCIGAFNWWSDPYAIWRPADVERLNRNLQVFFLRLSKPWQISRIKPSAAIVGSSRSGSINPQHTVWSGETPYNLSVHGLTVYEMKRFIEHSQAQGTLDKLLIAIEFDSFIISHPIMGLGFTEDRMLHSQADGMGWSELVQRVRDIRDTLFTSSTLAYSLQAQFGKAPPGRGMQADGSWRYPQTDRTGKKAFIGAGKLLLHRSRKSTEATIGKNLEILAEILVFCHRQKIDTRLYLSPEHLFMTDFRLHIGYGEERDNFLRQVVAVNEEAGINSGSPPFPLWGFGHMVNIVDHPMQEHGNSADWFRDGFHFYSKLGDIVMDQVWGMNGTAGMRLDAGSIDTYIAEVEKLRAQFVLDQEERVLDYRREILGEIPD